jgi:hypothetical protein
MSAEPVGIPECLEELRRVADRLEGQLRAGDGTARAVDAALKMFGTITAAFLTQLWAEPDHPAFLPSVGYYTMYGSPNPDTLYRNAAIDGSGEYLLEGHRGTVPDVSIMPFGPPVAGGLRTFAPFDFDDLKIEPDGTFEVALSAQRPAGAANWWRLEPEMRTLMLRSVSERWGEHVEPRVAIIRLDVDPRRRRPDPSEMRKRIDVFAPVVEGMIMSGVGRVAKLRGDGVVNRLVDVDYSGTGGGLAGQWYQEGCFALGGDEGLVIETHLDPGCSAFSLSLTDGLFSTVDWATAHSSLNRHQAVLDSDGGLRVVVAADDPGVHNWLDTTGHGFGVMQFRWSGLPAAPDVSVQKVAIGSLGELLPAGTARVTPAQRADAIRARQIGVQLRARW